MATSARPAKYPHGRHPNTLAVLRRHAYKPGQNGHGRVYPLKERLRHALDHPLKEPAPDAPHGEVIVYNTLKGAANLVPVAFRETWDRVEGKIPEETPPPQNVVNNLIINVLTQSGKEAIDRIVEGKRTE